MEEDGSISSREEEEEEEERDRRRVLERVLEGGRIVVASRATQSIDKC